MRKLLALFLLCCMPLTVARASYDFTGGGCMESISSSNYVAGNFPMTVVAWIWPTSIRSSDNYVFSGGNVNVGGWSFEIAGTTRCGANGMSFNKSNVVGICSTIVPTTSSWSCEAAVVSSTQVHFVQITQGGALSSQNVSDTHSFNAGGSSSQMTVGAAGTSVTALIGRAANAAAWYASLSDTEIKAYCFGGPLAVGRPLKVFYPMFETSAPNNAQGEQGVGNLAFFLTEQGAPCGTVATAPHSPTVDPYGGS